MVLLAYQRVPMVEPLVSIGFLKMNVRMSVVNSNGFVVCMG